MKIRKITPEEAKAIEVKHYDTGFSMWIYQPGLKGKRVILDASLFLENGLITLHPPSEHTGFTYGSILSKENKNEIMLVVIE